MLSGVREICWVGKGKSLAVKGRLFIGAVFWIMGLMGLGQSMMLRVGLWCLKGILSKASGLALESAIIEAGL